MSAMNADKHRFIEAVAVCAAALRDADLPDDGELLPMHKAGGVGDQP